MEVAENKIPAENAKTLRKKEWKFFFGILGIAFLIMVMALIEIFFGDIINLMFTYIPGFKSYYKSLSDVDKRTIVNMLFTTISMSVPSIIGMIIFLQKPNKMVPMKKVEGGKFWAVVFFGIGAAEVANYATLIISRMVDSFGLSTKYSDKNMGDNFMEVFLRVISIAVLPAIFEELIFRGAILQGLRKFSCDSFAIFFSAFLFGLVHGNIVQMPFAFLLGLCLAKVTVYTNSILPAMTIHFINNLISALMSAVQDSYVAGLLTVLLSFAMLAMMITGVIMIANLSKKDDKLFYTEPNKSAIPEKKMWLIAIVNIGILACISFYVYEAVTLMCGK